MQSAREALKKFHTESGNEGEANGEAERQGEDASARTVPILYSHLQRETEDEHGNQDAVIESDDSDWSCVSTDGSDDDHAVRRKNRFPAFDPKAEKITFCLGMTFRGPREFKEVVTRYSIQEQREVRIVRNTEE